MKKTTFFMAIGMLCSLSFAEEATKPVIESKTLLECRMTIPAAQRTNAEAVYTIDLKTDTTNKRRYLLGELQVQGMTLVNHTYFRDKIFVSTGDENVQEEWKLVMADQAKQIKALGITAPIAKAHLYSVQKDPFNVSKLDAKISEFFGENGEILGRGYTTVNMTYKCN